MRRVDSGSSCCNSPGEALHVSASSIALRPTVPDISEITDTRTHTDTHTQNTCINIIDIYYGTRPLQCFWDGPLLGPDRFSGHDDKNKPKRKFNPQNILSTNEKFPDYGSFWVTVYA